MKEAQSFKKKKKKKEAQSLQYQKLQKIFEITEAIHRKTFHSEGSEDSTVRTAALPNRPVHETQALP